MNLKMKKLPLTFGNCGTCPYSIADDSLGVRQYFCKLTRKILGLSLTDLYNQIPDSCPLEDVKPEGAT